MKYLKTLFKWSLSIVLILLILLASLLWIDAIQTNYLKRTNAVTDSSYLIKNVTIIPMTQDTLLTNRSVWIKGGLIENILEGEVSFDGPVIDGENGYLLPGLIDMHVHLWDRYELGLYLANGVTAVRNLWGMPQHLRWKQALEFNQLSGPILYTSGPKLTGAEFIGDDNLNLYSPEQARDKVIEYQQRGYDFIKTYYGLEPEIFEAIRTQAMKSGMDLIAHPSQKVPFVDHLKEPIRSIEHVEEIVQQPLNFELDTLKLQKIIQQLAKETKKPYTPTLVVFENINQMMQDDHYLDRQELQWINPLIRKVDSENQFNRWYQAQLKDPETPQRIGKQHRFHLEIVRKMHQAGIPIICGTDAGIGVTLPGFSIHQELAFYQEAGMTNFEVLKTATINAAQTHQKMNHLGTVAIGKTANLILVRENPLEQLRVLKKPEMVIVKGAVYKQQELQKFIERAKNRSNTIATFIRYVENWIVEK